MAAIAGRHAMAATAIAPAIAAMTRMLPIIRGDAFFIRTCSWAALLPSLVAWTPTPLLIKSISPRLFPSALGGGDVLQPAVTRLDAPEPHHHDLNDHEADHQPQHSRQLIRRH